jgi:hypothetical protein
MSDKPQVTTHYADGRPSEVREMTEEEIAQLQPIPEGNDETPSPA